MVGICHFSIEGCFAKIYTRAKYIHCACKVFVMFVIATAAFHKGCGLLVKNKPPLHMQIFISLA